MWRTEVASLVCQISDWQALLALVRRHRVFVLVHEALRDLPDGAPVPHAVMTDLAAMARSSRLDGLLQMAEARRIAELLSQADIPAVQLKGASLSQRLYGDPLMRHSIDIDLLVPLAQLGDAVRVLHGLGYCTDEHVPVTGGLHSQIQRRAYHHCMLHNRANVQLELHWRLGTFSQTHSGRLLDESLPDATTGLRVLPPSLELIYLVAHGTNHYWARLKWLSDIKQALLVLPPAAWKGFRDQAIAVGVEHAAEVTRCVLGWVFDIPSAELPRCTARLQARHLRSASYALRRMRAPIELQRGVRSIVDRTLYRLDCASPYHKVAALLRYVDTVRRSAAPRSTP
jgi:hypothetical protein